ncbi:putative condensin-2 complex subunit G2 [Apostichopus japonicus]|uniref:Putative condensin-2 complex subunit G2 n=1 Tax=Stichopus japonicus TaxID=307972 RepID=A0A2G8JV67_STIJA|nr:putative condensin-2 complex subunit G2 [Apostichopus japonicus]
MSTAEAVALMLLLCRCLRGCIKATQGNPPMNASGDSSISSSGDNELDKENEDVGEDAELSLKDKDVLNGMLEIIAILWTGIGNQLTKPSNQHLKMMLVKKFSKALPDFLANFQDARSIPAIMILASYLPASSIPSFRGRDVLELIGNWLELTLTSRQKTTDEYAKEEEQDKPLPSRARLLQSCTNEVIELIAILKKAMLCIEHRFVSASVLSFTTDEVLQKSLHSYLRLLLHIQSKITWDAESLSSEQIEAEEMDFSPQFEELLSWMSRELVPSLVIPCSDSSGSRSDIDQTLHQLAKDICQDLLQLFTDSVMLAVGGSQLPEQVSLFCKDVLQTDCAVTFLPTSVKVMYHLSQRMMKEQLDSPRLKIMADIKPGLTESLKLCQRHRYICPSLDHNIMSSMMAGIIMELAGNLAKKDGHVTLEPVNAVGLLPAVPAFLLSTVASSNAMVGSFVTEIHQCVRSGALEKNADIYAVLHILQALKEDKKKLPGLENCLGSVEAQLDALERGFENEENKRETEDGLDRSSASGLSLGRFYLRHKVNNILYWSVLSGT